MKAETKPRTLETEFSTNDSGSDGKARFVRNAHEENTMKIPPNENSVYLETPASGRETKARRMRIPGKKAETLTRKPVEGTARAGELS